MAHYFVNNHAQPNGDHEIHVLGCVRMPPDKRYLGNYGCASVALVEARKDFWQVEGCYACSPEFRPGYSPVEVARHGMHQRLRLR